MKIKPNKAPKREIQVNPFSEDPALKEGMFKVVPKQKERANGKSALL